MAKAQEEMRGGDEEISILAPIISSLRFLVGLRKVFEKLLLRTYAASSLNSSACRSSL